MITHEQYCKVISNIIGKQISVTHVPHIPGLYDEGFSYTDSEGVGYFINIYELCYKGKAWAKSLGYTLESRVTQNMNGACKIKKVRVITEKLGNTEITAIMNALVWVSEEV